eukprot:895784-Prorocentrum_minimum.AAC.1
MALFYGSSCGANNGKDARNTPDVKHACYCDSHPSTEYSAPRPITAAYVRNIPHPDQSHLGLLKRHVRLALHVLGAHAIDAVPLVGGGHPLPLKHMTQVPVALRAHDLCGGGQFTSGGGQFTCP